MERHLEPCLYVFMSLYVYTTVSVTWNRTVYCVCNMTVYCVLYMSACVWVHRIITKPLPFLSHHNKTSNVPVSLHSISALQIECLNETHAPNVNSHNCCWVDILWCTSFPAFYLTRSSAMKRQLEPCLYVIMYLYMHTTFWICLCEQSMSQSIIPASIDVFPHPNLPFL